MTLPEVLGIDWQGDACLITALVQGLKARVQRQVAAGGQRYTFLASVTSADGPVWQSAVGALEIRGMATARALCEQALAAELYRRLRTNQPQMNTDAERDEHRSEK